jgi:hypothetical protein
MKKVKDILKNYEKQFDIKEVTIFDTNGQVAYSDSYNNLLDTKNDIISQKERRRILSSDCKKCIPFNDSKLFIFLYKHDCSDCKNKTDNGFCKYGYGYICHGKQWKQKERKKP